jgi:acyl-coenzyme A thioesterase PaaI-like protein
LKGKTGIVNSETLHTDLVKMRSRVHPHCVVCGCDNRRGLGLEFAVSDDGVVEGSFDCNRTFEGYADILHGGVVSSLLDGAMTHCMFARGRSAVTAELIVRFRHPVTIDHKATIRAWITRDESPLYILKAEVSQEGQIKATATGKFMDPPPLANATGTLGRMRQ